MWDRHIKQLSSCTQACLSRHAASQEPATVSIGRGFGLQPAYTVALLLLRSSCKDLQLGLVACTTICLCWLAKLTSPPALQYVKWAGAKGPDAFFTDKKARKLFKDHIDVVVNRRNSINGRLYKEVSPWLQSVVWSIRSLKCMRRP